MAVATSSAAARQRSHHNDRLGLRVFLFRSAENPSILIGWQSRRGFHNLVHHRLNPITRAHASISPTETYDNLPAYSTLADSPSGCSGRLRLRTLEAFGRDNRLITGRRTTSVVS